MTKVTGCLIRIGTMTDVEELVQVKALNTSSGSISDGQPFPVN